MITTSHHVGVGVCVCDRIYEKPTINPTKNVSRSLSHTLGIVNKFCDRHSGLAGRAHTSTISANISIDLENNGTHSHTHTHTQSQLAPSCLLNDTHWHKHFGCILYLFFFRRVKTAPRTWLEFYWVRYVMVGLSALDRAHTHTKKEHTCWVRGNGGRVVCHLPTPKKHIIFLLIACV